MPQPTKPLLIDGKPVRKFMFARYSRIAVNGAIPVDRKERARVLNRDERRFVVSVQVEAFDKDHAIARLVELYPMVAKADWEFIEELDPEHDIGMLGAKHPLNPIVVPASKKIH